MKVLQLLRDIAEEQCVQCVERCDKDSADAWDDIFSVLTEAEQNVRHLWNKIQQRRGLFAENPDTVLMLRLNTKFIGGK